MTAGSSAKPKAAKEPTDLELMMFADGELDELRKVEIATFVDGSAAAKNKLKAMGIVGDFVRKDADRVATAFRADGVAAKVMAAIEAGPIASETVNAALIEPIAGRKTTQLKPKRPEAANDNARTIYLLAALSAAAAIALGIWGRSPGPAPLSPDRAALQAAADSDAPSQLEVVPPPSAQETIAKVAAAQPDADESPGVKVARVNWGENKPGAVYYVPSDGRGSTTTVVWLASE
jgi:hypothetical protein